MNSNNLFLSGILDYGAHHPDVPFVVSYDDEESATVNWRDFIDLSLKYARFLGELPVSANKTVFIILRQAPELQAAFLGAMLAGLVPSFLPYPNAKQDHAIYWQQHRRVFERTQPDAIVVYDELFAAVTDAAGGTQTTIIRESSVAASAGQHPDRLPDYDDIALLQHSSGTTGLKKGVALSYRAIELQIQAYGKSLRLDQIADAKIASWLPLYHDMGLFTAFLMPMRLGIPVVSLDPFIWVAEPALLLRAIDQHQATHVWLPNFAFLHLVRGASRRKTFNLASIEAFVSCSEPCKDSTFETFRQRFEPCGLRAAALQTCYAMAETVFAVSQSLGDHPRQLRIDRQSLFGLGAVQLSDAAEAPVILSNGPPIDGVKIAVMRDSMPMGELEIGEICIEAGFMFTEYYGDPETTKLALNNGLYRSGDLGFVYNGEIYITGRIKDVIIVNGKNLFAHDVEAAVATVPGLKAGRAVAFGKYDDRIGSELLVVVAEHDWSARSMTDMMKDINHAVLDALGVACAAVKIVDPGWLVKTTSGKISRADNAKKYETPSI